MNSPKIQALILVWFCTFTQLSQAQNQSLDVLKQNIQNTLSRVEGNFAVAFKDLKTGKTLFINEKESFHAASTMKTPVMIEVFKQAKAGKFKMTDAIPVKNSFKSIVDSSAFSLNIADDSADTMYQKIGHKMTIYDLTYQMIIRSSNLATNIIIELVGAQNVNATMRKMGAKDIQILRGVEDTKAFQKGLNNTVTAYDLMLIYEKIAKHKAVSKHASKEMLKILTDQKFNDVIPAKLPKNVVVAHKTGSITGVHHDSGIVYLPDGRKYIVVLLSKKLVNDKAAIEAMSSVSEMLYQYLTL
jgi:beta-lactamase class A